MEGRQSRSLKDLLSHVRHSLRWRLIAAVCGISLLTGAAASAYTYAAMRAEMQDFIDEELHQIAAVVINYNMLIPRRWEGPRHRHERAFRRMRLRQQMRPVPSLSDLNTERFDIVIAPLIGKAGDAVYMPIGAPDGLYTVLMGDSRVRVMVSTKLDGQRFMVARPLSSGAAISTEALQLSMTQFAALSVIYCVLAALAVSVLFGAVNRLAAAIRRRDEHDLSPIVDKGGQIPTELHAFIEALNGMLARIAESIHVKQRFIADAAHEMRTPLTALSLQAENLLNAPLTPEVALKVRQLQQGIARETQLMHDLLTLARLQHQQQQAPQTFNLQDVLIEILEELGPIADEKEIDFGLEGKADLQVTLLRNELKTVLYNLASNALKYTPVQGRVDLFVSFTPAPAPATGGELKVGVRDNGPGIPEAALKSIFEPFFRVKGDRETVAGTGLGLAIAKAAAQRLQGKLSLNNRSTGGLEAALLLMC
ncbi:MAG: HAMP domain-containing histidine kinase [Candidatus Anaerobiospirillum merdipullorum]|uniref:histidine kinase n=1 Tax=Candidatus Anaerobiospirillum merdipullorum TaxID=2838450 RepID=A0A9E2KN59_9GAMM|nr:HAMP domain-containing histidine kinase [Candidatus Anaerobiospirillum merdipullorum]